jgi:hypothetical protein
LLALILLLFAADRTPAQAQTVCPFIYMPVCGLTHSGIRLTFPNACVAHSAGAQVLHPGMCEGPICNRLYKPVCAIDPKTHRPRTYPNLCESEDANAVWLHNGRCRWRR